MKSVNDWVKDQCGETAVTDASGVVPSIESDRADFGATGSIAYTSRSARFLSRLGMWVAYIMFTVRTCGGNPFCPLLFGGLGPSLSSLFSPLSLCSALNLPACLNTQQSLLV